MKYDIIIHGWLKDEVMIYKGCKDVVYANGLLRFRDVNNKLFVLSEHDDDIQTILFTLVR